MAYRIDIIKGIYAMKRYIELFVVMVFLFPSGALAQWAVGHGPQKNSNETKENNYNNHLIYGYTEKEKEDAEKSSIQRDNCHNPERILIKKGKNEATVSGVVTRFSGFCYVISANKGQKLEINFFDSTRNMGVIVFNPGWIYRKLVQGGDVPDGKIVESFDISEKKSAQAVLSESGNYLIVMAITTGGAGGYKVRIKIQ